MGLTHLTLADTTSNGATTNTQTTTSGSNTTISGGYSQESTTTYASGSSSNTTSNSTTNAYTGDQRVVNSSSAPSMSAMSQDLCVVGMSGGVSSFGLGISAGSYRTDENCERIKLSKVLNDLGMKVAAVSVLCQDERVWDGMWMAGTPCPFLGSIGKDAKQQWETNQNMIPEGTDMIQMMPVKKEDTKEKKTIKKGGGVDEKTGLSIFSGLAVLLFLL